MAPKPALQTPSWKKTKTNNRNAFHFIMEKTSTTQIPSPTQQASPPAADCERVNTILDQLVVGQQPTVEDEEYIVDHADDCSPCFDSIDKQRAFIGFLMSHVGRKGAPNSLPHTILSRLQTEMA